MGYAIANELAERGAHVELVSGPVSLKADHPNINLTKVTSASEMNEQCLHIFPRARGAVMCAAVADYAPVEMASHKIKRSDGNMTIELKPNPDIAAALGSIKQQGQLLVGFALETQNETQNALLKLRKKNLDMIVLNSLNEPGAGFQSETNKITIINKYNNSFNFELKTKAKVAIDIVDRMIAEMAL